MNPLTLEIQGTGTHNRGAELMAIAIAEKMRATYPDVRLVVPPGFGDFAARARHGFFTTWEFQGRIRSRLSAMALQYGSPGVRSVLGVVHPREVDAVLDASGFAFSDQWGSEGAVYYLRKMQHPDRRHQPLILLPQAMGPFNNREVASNCRKLFDRAALICARDQKSYEAVSILNGAEKLRKYPDFTLGVAPVLPPDLTLPERFSAIVPNIRMIDKTSSGGNYLEFLNQAIRLLAAKGMNPVFVLHDADEDRRIIPMLDQARPIPILEHSDPRVLKGILGRAELVVGSRFHALVSALSQGVPCIGAGWSHKYVELFNDFDATRFLIQDLEDISKLSALIEELAGSDHRSKLSTGILVSADRLKTLSRQMWQEVEAILQATIPSLRAGTP